MISFGEFKDKYVYDCQLSEGAYGKVCRIKEKTTKKCLALKKISARKKQQLDDALKEIDFLVRFRNTFVVEVRVFLCRSGKHIMFKLIMALENPCGKSEWYWSLLNALFITLFEWVSK